jgi:DNA-binding response OmpR family regulator
MRMMKLEKRRILVIENDLSLCCGIQEILELEGFLPLVTRDANAAMQVFNAFFPDLTIIGFGSRPSPAQLQFMDAHQGFYPMIYLCYHFAAKDLLREQWRISADTILTKPFDLEEFLRMIFSTLEFHKRLNTF